MVKRARDQLDRGDLGIESAISTCSDCKRRNVRQGSTIDGCVSDKMMTREDTPKMNTLSKTRLVYWVASVQRSAENEWSKQNLDMMYSISATAETTFNKYDPLTRGSFPVETGRGGNYIQQVRLCNTRVLCSRFWPWRRRHPTSTIIQYEGLA